MQLEAGKGDMVLVEVHSNAGNAKIALLMSHMTWWMHACGF